MKDMTRNIESRVTGQGQTTLPKPVLEALGLKAGDRVRYFIADSTVQIVPVLPISRLFGALPYDGPPISVEEMEQAIAESVSHGACVQRENQAAEAMKVIRDLQGNIFTGGRKFTREEMNER